MPCSEPSGQFVTLTVLSSSPNPLQVAIVSTVDCTEVPYVDLSGQQRMDIGTTDNLVWTARDAGVLVGVLDLPTGVGAYTWSVP